MLTNPWRLPVRRNSFANDVAIRPPVAANGWPSAIELPFTLSLLMSNGCFLMTASLRPVCFSKNYGELRHLIVARTCAAKASWTSNKSMSSAVSCALANAGPQPSAGASKSCGNGSYPQNCQLFSVTSVGRLSSFAFRSDMTSVAHAPSVSAEDVAAVTVPFVLRKTGLMVGIFVFIFYKLRWMSSSLLIIISDCFLLLPPLLCLGSVTAVISSLR